MRKNWYWLFLIVFCCLTLSACSNQPSRSAFLDTPEATGILEPPEAFADLINPFAGDPAAAKEGEMLYQANCVSCHGATLEGDGEVSAGIDPKPQNLAERHSEVSDAYLYWRISEGGLMEPFNSLMPAWRGLLAEEQIWQVITYIRTF